MRRAAVLILIAIPGLICGCGDDTTAGLGDPVSISGKFTLDSKALADTEVEFYNSGGKTPAKYRRYTATTGADGAYQIAEIYPAEYTVSVIPKESSVIDEQGGASATATDPLAKYGAESPLRAAVSAEKTTFDFDLTSSADP